MMTPKQRWKKHAGTVRQWLYAEAEHHGVYNFQFDGRWIACMFNPDTLQYEYYADDANHTGRLRSDMFEAFNMFSKHNYRHPALIHQIRVDNFQARQLGFKLP